MILCKLLKRCNNNNNSNKKTNNIIKSLSTVIEGLDEKDLQYFGKKKQSGVSLTALMETGRGERLKEFDLLIDDQAIFFKR